MKHCVGAAIIHNGKLLLMQRPTHEDVYPDHWELPGGGIDAGETHEQAVKREVMEEVGLTVTSVGKAFASFGDQRHDETDYLVEVADVNLKTDPNEVQNIKWVSTVDDIKDLLLTSEMRQSVELTLEEIN